MSEGMCPLKRRLSPALVLRTAEEVTLGPIIINNNNDNFHKESASLCATMLPTEVDLSAVLKNGQFKNVTITDVIAGKPHTAVLHTAKKHCSSFSEQKSTWL